MDTITRGAETFSAALLLFDAILIGWVSNHFSVGLIMLQRPCSDAVALQGRCIPKFNDDSIGAPTLSRAKKCLFMHN